MSKIEEIIEKYDDDEYFAGFEEIKDMMREYAEYCMNELMTKLHDQSVLNPDCYHADDLKEWIFNILKYPI